jgi:hypothetical protein
MTLWSNTSTHASKNWSAFVMVVRLSQRFGRR